THGLGVEAYAIVLHPNPQQVRLRLSASDQDKASATGLDHVGDRCRDQTCEGKAMSWRGFDDPLFRHLPANGYFQLIKQAGEPMTQWRYPLYRCVGHDRSGARVVVDDLAQVVT